MAAGHRVCFILPPFGQDRSPAGLVKILKAELNSETGGSIYSNETYAVFSIKRGRMERKNNGIMGKNRRRLNPESGTVFSFHFVPIIPLVPLGRSGFGPIRCIGIFSPQYVQNAWLRLLGILNLWLHFGHFVMRVLSIKNPSNTYYIFIIKS